MGRLENHQGREARFERLLPAGRHDAPAIARLQAREHPLRLRGAEVVAVCAAEVEKLIGHHRTDNVDAVVARTSSTSAVSVPTGQGLE